MKKDKSVRAQIKDLETGGAATFPLARYDYVVSCKQRLASTLGRTYVSSIDNIAATVTVTRGEDKPLHGVTAINNK